MAFLAGCPWRCAYCQNHALQSPQSATLGEEELFDFLERRRGLLDGVVLSGGEPLAQEGAVDAARRAREMGFCVGLHTCGAYPERLERILPYLDWVGLDVKAPWGRYDEVVRASASVEPVRRSLELVAASDVDLEVRTTWHPQLLDAEDLRAIAHELASRGVGTWAVQAYRHLGTAGELPDQTVYPSDVPADLPPLFASYEFRRA